MVQPFVFVSKDFVLKVHTVHHIWYILIPLLNVQIVLGIISWITQSRKKTSSDLRKQKTYRGIVYCTVTIFSNMCIEILLLTFGSLAIVFCIIILYQYITLCIKFPLIIRSLFNIM